MPFLHVHIYHMTDQALRAGTSRHSSTTHSLMLCVYDTSSSTHPPSLPLRPAQQKLDPDSLNVISVMSSSDSTRPPPLRSAHKSKIHTTQFMAHVHVPSLPPSPRKSDYAPVKQRPRTRNRWSSGMGKAGAGDNSGLNDPMHLLQALATAFYLTQRIRTWHRRRRPQHNIRTDYGRGSTQRLRRDTRTESLSDSASMEIVVTSPTKRPRKYAASNNYTEVIPCIAAQKGQTTPCIHTND